MGDVGAPPLLGGWLAVCGLKTEARVWGGRAVVGGGRSDLLAKRLETAMAAERPTGLVSFGVAGALRPELRVGDVVIGSAVRCGAQRWPCDPATTAQLVAALSARSGEVAAGDAVAATVETKRALAAEALTVDMESHVAAQAASAHGLPLAVIRVVSDEARHVIPPAAVAGMCEDGGVDIAAVLLGLARDPRQLPALIRMGRSAGRAFRRLEQVRRLLREAADASV